MADRAITALPAATSLTSSDLFVLSQSNQAKSATWQLIIGYLTTALDGHGGIQSISKTSTSGLVDTYTVTLADTTTYTFSVTNGNGIASVTKSTSGLTDTYTLTYDDGTTYSWTVTNGNGIASFTGPTSSGLSDTYTFTFDDGSTETFTVVNGKEISSITDYWAVSDSNSTEPSTWYTAVQTMTTTYRYLWHYQTITFNNSTTLDTTKSVVGVYGDTGQDWYVHVRWAANEPTSDSDIESTADDWIGIYSGTSSTAPTTYTSYTWFQYKGDTGDTGTSIASVSLYSTSGLVDTYRVYFSDGTFTSFQVTNGSSISTIAKTSSSSLTDTYTVTLTDGSTTTFTVTNGKGISSITEVDVTHVAGHTDVYRINFNDGDTYTFSIYNGVNGTGSVSTVDGIQSSNSDVPLLTFGSGAPTTSTVGELKSRYFDQTNNILYICTNIDTSSGTASYTWQGAGVTVDSALSTMSTNPVQNAVLTTLLGTATLTTTAQTVTGATNELDAEMGSATLTTTAQTAKGAINELKTSIDNKMFIKSGTITSGSGDSTLATDTSLINASTDIANVWFSAPQYVTSSYTITTNASGQLIFNGTRTGQTTVYVVLFNP